MRAVHITAYGEPPELAHSVPEPTGPGALVATTVAPVTPLDVLCASGTSYFGGQPLPYVPGVQGVGVVRSAETLAPGTRVWFPTTAGMAPGDGSLAELVRVPEEELVALPDDVEDAVVAAIGLSGVAALMALTWRGGLRAGECVLVLGAGGMVGQVAVQLARLHGATRVVAADRSAAHCRDALPLGADAAVVLTESSPTTDLAEELRRAAGRPIDLVIDPLCGYAGTAALAALGPGGRLVQLGGSAGPTAVLDSAVVRSGSLSVLGYTNNSLTAEQRTQALLTLVRHTIEDGLTAQHELVDLVDLPGAWARQAAGAAPARVVARLS